MTTAAPATSERGERCEGPDLSVVLSSPFGRGRVRVRSIATGLDPLSHWKRVRVRVRSIRREAPRLNSPGRQVGVNEVSTQSGSDGVRPEGPT